MFGRKKTGNIIIPEDKYSWLVNNSKVISEDVNKLIENAKYTEEYKEEAAKDRQRAERSVTRVEEELREEVQRRFDENYKEQIQATERAKRNRDKTDTILKIKTIFSSMGIGLSHIHMITPLPVGMEALSKSSYFLTS